mmetsp:Transcript_9199/g.20504  ORF Transcript_9199/g.20504 Transcript_9199/m.20504 type:complete len:534 (-) Transcript_9199:35-1636(-)
MLFAGWPLCLCNSRTAIAGCALLWYLLASPVSAETEQPTPASLCSAQGHQLLGGDDGCEEDDVRGDVHLLQIYGSVIPHDLGLKLSQIASSPRLRFECTGSQDCRFHQECEQNTCFRMQLGDAPLVDFWITVLIFVAAAVSLAAGVSGGGVYVPLMMLLLGMGSREASAASPALQFGAATTACMYNIVKSHPARPHRLAVNFQLATLIGASLMAGAQVGSLLHAWLPSLAILVLLALTMLSSIRSALRTAIKMTREESAALASGECKESETPKTPKWLEPDEADQTVWRRNLSAMLVLSVVWIISLGLTVLQGFVLSSCSAAWWLARAGIVSILGLSAVAYAAFLSLQDPADEHDVDFKQLAWPLVGTSLFAGAIAALCGIGGGIVLSPILVEYQVLPSVTSATMNATLLVFSSSTLLTYILMNAAPWDYSLCLGMAAMAGSLTGQVLFASWVKRVGKQSILVWLLVASISISLLLLLYQGVSSIIMDPLASTTFADICQVASNSSATEAVGGSGTSDHGVRRNTTVNLPEPA